MRLRALIPLAIAFGLGGCASMDTIAPPVTPAMVSTSRVASAETLNEGRRIFTGACASCHAPDPLSKYSLSEWHDAVNDMAPRAKLNPARRAALLAYINAAKASGATSQ